jgi:hypothetical protein
MVGMFLCGNIRRGSGRRFVRRRRWTCFLRGLPMWRPADLCSEMFLRRRPWRRRKCYIAGVRVSNTSDESVIRLEKVAQAVECSSEGDYARMRLRGRFALFGLGDPVGARYLR